MPRHWNTCAGLQSNDDDDNDDDNDNDHDHDDHDDDDDVPLGHLLYGPAASRPGRFSFSPMPTLFTSLNVGSRILATLLI